MALPVVTMECRAVADPELRFSPSGVAVGSLRVVASSRKKGEDGQWTDDKTCFINVTCFKQYAENIVESVTKGDMLLVTGRLQEETWEDKDTQQKRSRHVIIADEVAIPMRFRTVKHGEGKVERAASNENWAGQPQNGGDEPPF